MADGPLLVELQYSSARFTRLHGVDIDLVTDYSPALHRRISSGERFDVVVLQPDWLDDLAARGLVAAAPHLLTHRIEVGLAMRPGQAKPDISTSERLLECLRTADRVLINSVASGRLFEATMHRLGVHSQIAPSIERVRPEELYQRLADGNDTTIGVGTVPMIRADPRVSILDSLPPEWRTYIDYMASTSVISPNGQAAATLVKHLCQEISLKGA